MQNKGTKQYYIVCKERETDKILGYWSNDSRGIEVKEELYSKFYKDELYSKFYKDEGIEKAIKLSIELGLFCTLCELNYRELKTVNDKVEKALKKYHRGIK